MSNTNDGCSLFKNVGNICRWFKETQLSGIVNVKFPETLAQLSLSFCLLEA
ncbi:MAG: hypothetical protein LBF43_01075 [Puniceicoccales bacterium]|nr:hypothetical protein [Puniceicoccales bacterium]